jgi:sugar phosphate isomerase/epimerase
VLVAGSPTTEVDPQGCSTFLALEELIRSAEGTGIVVALEPEPDTVINGIYEFSLIAAHMAGSPLGLNLDLGHAALTEGDPIAVIDEWSSFIMHVHVEDIRRPQHVHLLPGDGHLDLLRMIRKLRESGFAGDLTVDLFDILDAPDVWAQRAMERMRLLLA